MKYRKSPRVISMHYFAIIENHWLLHCSLPRTFKEDAKTLEQKQYKKESIQSKIILVLKLPRFFPRRKGGEKAGQFQNWILFYFMESVLYCLSSKGHVKLSRRQRKGLDIILSSPHTKLLKIKGGASSLAWSLSKMTDIS